MRTPVSMLVAGVVLFIAGFGLGSANIDPASAIVATVAMAVFAVGLVWLVVIQVRSARTRERT